MPVFVVWRLCSSVQRAWAFDWCGLKRTDLAVFFTVRVTVVTRPTPPPLPLARLFFLQGTYGPVPAPCFTPPRAQQQNRIAVPTTTSAAPPLSAADEISCHVYKAPLPITHSYSYHLFLSILALPSTTRKQHHLTNHFCWTLKEVSSHS